MVVLGHIRGGIVGRVIYMIHMPAFIIVSGYFFKPEKNNNFSESGLKPETKDQSGISRIILSVVGIMVIALIGLVIREKRKP
jgi:surface polysaccharide O-acyltransferase-like enzyme